MKPIVQTLRKWIQWGQTACRNCTRKLQGGCGKMSKSGGYKYKSRHRPKHHKSSSFTTIHKSMQNKKS